MIAIVLLAWFAVILAASALCLSWPQRQVSLPRRVRLAGVFVVTAVVPGVTWFLVWLHDKHAEAFWNTGLPTYLSGFGTLAAVLVALTVAFSQHRERVRERRGKGVWKVVVQIGSQFALVNRDWRVASNVTIKAADPDFVFIRQLGSWNIISPSHSAAFVAELKPGMTGDPTIIVEWFVNGQRQEPYQQPLPLQQKDGKDGQAN